MCTQCDLYATAVNFKHLSTENDCETDCTGFLVILVVTETTTNPKFKPIPNSNHNPIPNPNPNTNPSGGFSLQHLQDTAPWWAWSASL